MEDLQSDDEKYELAYGCLRLFAEVDINGDGGMDWKEFMQYIIDAVSGNNIEQEGPQAGPKDMTVKDQIESIKAAKFKRFSLNMKALDINGHDDQIIKMLKISV